MVPKRAKKRAIEKSNYRIYLQKAQEFYETMHQAKDRNNWNAVCGDFNILFCIQKKSSNIVPPKQDTEQGEL